MEHEIIAKNEYGAEVRVALINYPGECPICHHRIAVECLAAARRRDEVLDALFRCPQERCLRMFIGTYKKKANSWRLETTGPVTAKKAGVPEEVASLSPAFVEIYNQALAAEAANMDQLFGMGLRKALEFLVKDYLVSLHPNEGEKIRRMKLGACIEKYVDNVKLKSCAKRAVWLGNDETHYVRRWESKDITDLKQLIRATISWVELELLTRGYTGAMPDGGPPAAEEPTPASG